MLDRAQKVALDMEPILRAAGTKLLSLTLGNFNKAGADFRPHEWDALSKAYARRVGRTEATLKLRGVLSTSFRLEVSKNSAVMSSFVPYAAIHQWGGFIQQAPRVLAFKERGGFLSRRAAGKQTTGAIRVAISQGHLVEMPARPFVPVTPEGELTDAAAEQMISSAQRALDRQLS